MNKIILVVVILAIIIVALLGVLIFIPGKVSNKPNFVIGTDGLQINGLVANQEISSPLKITGKVIGNGWGGFEGQVGAVELLDGNGKSIASGVLTATSEWMTLPVNFETTLSFQSNMSQSGNLVFHNENPSDMRDKDKTFVLPVKIIKASSETMSVNVYFMNNNLDPEASCNKVFSVQRIIPKTQAIARATLEELLKGPTSSEVTGGFSTIINPGVKIQSLTIDDKGVARADFSQELESTGGSCRVTAIRAEITQTLKQFSTIKNVIISINGEVETILQP